ncbi:MAG: type IV pili methyl-accepting chemotaxis transducer N-terminal domain-containing protein, partial [Alphaproteobacteria bacterium]|nr:type IV pili methyl-accepting chemotaxis transducer N-terminal domain-containing protein [Alphaproteobacteria bacterium]
MTTAQQFSLLKRLSVAQKLALIVVGFTVFMAAIVGFTVVMLKQQESEALTIDMAGRQRMLTQQYLREVTMATTGIKTDYAATWKVFDTTLAALLNGGQVTDNLATGHKVMMPASTLPDAGQRLSTQRGLSRRLEQTVNALLKLPPGDAGRAERLAEAAAIGDELLDAANDLTKALDAQSDARMSATIDWELGIALMGVMLGVITSLAIARGIGGPLASCVEMARNIAAGNLNVPKLAVTSADEIGQLSNPFNQMLDAMRAMAGQTHNITENLHTAAAEIVATIQHQASATKEQAVAVQQITSTVEEISRSGMQVSERAREVASTAATASGTGGKGLEAMRDIGRAMEAIREQAGTVAEHIVALSEKTQAVGVIIATVNDIAEQSNLVALNAAIEAAGAREEGRRFSVVANEIKNLADQAKEATGQVRSILEEIQKGITTSVLLTEEAVKRVELGREKTDVAEHTIHNMADSIQESVNAFQQIVGATNQQQIGLEQLTQALREIYQASQQTAVSTGQLGQAATSLGSLAGLLR